MPLVDLRDVRTYFYLRHGLFRTFTVRAVDGVSLSIEPAETLSVVGESGSGKSTLGRTSLRLLPMEAGQVLFDGTDVTRERESNLKWLRRQAQPVFQDPYSTLDPFMTVEQILEEPLVIHGGPDGSDRAELLRKALTDVRLTPVEEFLPKFPHMLSGGQRQRVGIARALMLQPKYIVADEPVSMIDASSRAEILHVFRELQRKYNIAFMYITHDLATAKYFSDRIAVMYLGKIAELGKTSEVLREPLHPYTAALMDAVPDPDPTNRFRPRPVVPGEPPNAISPPSGCRFHPRCPIAIERCRQEEPPLTAHRPGHYAACWRAGEYQSRGLMLPTVPTSTVSGQP